MRLLTLEFSHADAGTIHERHLPLHHPRPVKQIVADQERPVQIGVEGAHRLEILGGLAEGDRVVIGSRSQFRPGEAVEPRPIEEPKDGPEGSL